MRPVDVYGNSNLAHLFQRVADPWSKACLLREIRMSVSKEGSSLHPFSGSRHLKRLISFTDSGIGAGIDSYYEYCLKAYILLGDTSYLEKFNKVSSRLCFLRKRTDCLLFYILLPRNVAPLSIVTRFSVRIVL